MRRSSRRTAGQSNRFNDDFVLTTSQGRGTAKYQIETHKIYRSTQTIRLQQATPKIYKLKLRILSMHILFLMSILMKMLLAKLVENVDPFRAHRDNGQKASEYLYCRQVPQSNLNQCWLVWVTKWWISQLSANHYLWRTRRSMIMAKKFKWGTKVQWIRMDTFGVYRYKHSLSEARMAMSWCLSGRRIRPE